MSTPFHRRDVRFESQRLSCAAWYYVPADLAPGERRAAIVMAHGWSGVKEMCLANFADAFAAAGFVVLVFDYRYLGGSDGEPRGQILPDEQRRDYQNAITWVASQREVDPELIGLFGTSYSGGHVLVVAAEDRRVKAVVAHVPAVGVRSTTLRWLRRGMFSEVWRAARLIVRQLLRPGQTLMIPVVSAGGGPATLPGKEAWQWKQRTAKLAPAWKNEVTVRSVIAGLRDSVRPFIPRIAPTPLLMVVASRDHYCFTDEQLRAFATAGEPKKLLQVEGGHFDFYEEPGLAQVLPAQVEWFTRHLTTAARAAESRA
ncbi:MAG TPA: alpha/beta hydrolase [Pirellulales bacterium]|nr:alpha/beta hydrolase [Pirellulales bacterium]